MNFVIESLCMAMFKQTWCCASDHHWQDEIHAQIAHACPQVSGALNAMQAQHQRQLLVHSDVQADILIEGHIAADIIPLLLLDHHAFVGNTSPTGGASLTEDSTPSGQSHMRSRLLTLHLGCLTACIPVHEWPPNNLQLQ